MENIHPEILSSLDNIFKKRQRPLSLHTEYRKWLRYFLDFQTKYPQPGEQSVQVRLFSENLRSKGQTEMQVKQAADAISLFLILSKRRRLLIHRRERELFIILPSLLSQNSRARMAPRDRLPGRRPAWLPSRPARRSPMSRTGGAKRYYAG